MRLDVILRYVYAAIFTVLLGAGLYAEHVRVTGETVLSALNVALAADTVFLLGFVLLLGPLSRLFVIFDRLLIYRKELGIMSFFTGFAHVYFVMFPLAHNGPWGLYRSRPFSAYPGLEALIILFVLLLLSWNWAMHKLGTKLWWQIQYWGVRSAFVLITIHMVVLKYQTILSWFVPNQLSAAAETNGPPILIWEAQFLLLVLLVRFSELFGPKAARVITQISAVCIGATFILVTFFR